LDQGDGFIIGGAPGVGKSWLAFDLALAVASGGMWLDKFPTTQGRVLICDAESGARSLYDRLQMLLAGNPFYQDGQENIFLRPEAQIKLDNPQGLVTIQRMMERYRPALVIFDTMVRFHAGDENSTREMAAFFALSQSLKVAYNSAILFTHHVRKPMKDEAGDECNLLRGSSDIRGWPEGVLLVKPHGNDGTQITLDHCKSRNHEKQPDFIVGRIIDSHDGTARLGYQGQK
jgi:RecA-family ATPase